MNVTANEAALFSLFHHNIYYKDNFFDFDSDHLKSLSENRTESIEDIAEILIEIVREGVSGCTNEEISLTLTGGMDSRTILACLLSLGIKPNCLTYGNQDAKDVVFGKRISDAFGLQFHNVSSVKPTKEWYLEWVIETIRRDGGNSHLHRAHRTAAMAEHCDLFAPKVLFTGHMGGEGLRGLTYNNYFASRFFEEVNEKMRSMNESADQIIDHYFVRWEKVDFEVLLGEVKRLPWMRSDSEINKFHFLYDMVAKIHHSQDLRIYQSFIPKVVPVFLQKRYLEVMFGSNYNFLAKGTGILGRLRNPHIYCRLLEIIFPKLLDYPLANGFTPGEYLKGLWYYVPVKLYRDFRTRDRHPATFSYGQWYVDFVREQSERISENIWEIFDRDRYMCALRANHHQSDEGYWHRFSNPIYFDLKEKIQSGGLN